MTYDRRALVLSGMWAVGYVCASLPLTTAGLVCGGCLSFLAGVFGRRLLDRWTPDREVDTDRGEE